MKKIAVYLCAVLAMIVTGLAPAWGATVLDQSCVMEMVQEANASMTLAELREACKANAVVEVGVAEVEPQPVLGNVEQRLEAESEAVSRPFSLMAHKPNYVLAGAYNREGWTDRTLAQEPVQTSDYKHAEAQFQISIKVPLAIGLFNDRVDWYAAYTNRSFWQVYDHVDSEPFRETNHEPESWLQMKNDWTVFGFRNSVNSVGIVHQSNGQSGDQSRTWNRLYANFIFEKGHWAMEFKPWVWIFRDYGAEDNPDIDDYFGHGELRAAYANKGHVISGMIRNQFESGFDRGALELGWSFPLFGYPYFKGYVQYFYGYGESLLDYNHKVNRIGIGISVTDWLN